MFGLKTNTLSLTKKPTNFFINNNFRDKHSFIERYYSLTSPVKRLQNSPFSHPKNSLTPKFSFSNFIYRSYAIELDVRSEVKFSDLDISPARLELLQSKGLTNAFPIQAQTYDHIFRGKDVLARAKTGTGKTIAFLLPLLERHFRQKSRRGPPTIIILEPTRELTLQVISELEGLANQVPCLPCYGGASINVQIQKLQRDFPAIVVGTPGRIIDLIEREALDLSQIKSVVLDEADRMLDMGFKEDMDKILQFTPRDRQTCLFSATIPPFVKKIIRDYTKNCVTVDLIGSDDSTIPVNVGHHYFLLQSTTISGKIKETASLMEQYAKDRTILFCQTKIQCSDVCVALNRLRIDAQPLHGDIPQGQRESTLRGFRDGDFKVLVATDVAARGLDIPEVDLVLQIGPPNDFDSYVHRSGRCGRAGRKGLCIIVVNKFEVASLQSLSRFIGIPITDVSTADTGESRGDYVERKVKSALTNIEEVPPHKYLKLQQYLPGNLDYEEMFLKALTILSGADVLTSHSLLSNREHFITISISKADSGLITTDEVDQILKGGSAFTPKIYPTESDDAIYFEILDKNSHHIAKLFPKDQYVVGYPSTLPKLRGYQKPNAIHKVNTPTRSSGFSASSPTSNYGSRSQRSNNDYFQKPSFNRSSSPSRDSSYSSRKYDFDEEGEDDYQPKSYKTRKIVDDYDDEIPLPKSKPRKFSFADDGEDVVKPKKHFDEDEDEDDFLPKSKSVRKQASEGEVMKETRLSFKDWLAKKKM